MDTIAKTLTNALKIPTTVPMEIPFAKITRDHSSAFVKLNFAGTETTAEFIRTVLRYTKMDNNSMESIQLTLTVKVPLMFSVIKR